MGSLRNWYLGALGVVRYVPRDQVEEAVAQDPDATIDSDSTVTMPPPAEAPLQNAPTRSAPRPDRAMSADPAPGEEPVAFRLAFWQPSPGLVVCSDMAPTARVAEPQQAMLANLLRAIGHLNTPLPAAEVIDWPQGRTDSPGLAGAREFVEIFFQVKSQLQPFSSALLMGTLAASVVGGREAEVGEQIPLPWSATGIVTHSLHEMTVDPALKRPTWEAIRHLADKG